VLVVKTGQRGRGAPAASSRRAAGRGDSVMLVQLQFSAANGGLTWASPTRWPATCATY